MRTGWELSTVAGPKLTSFENIAEEERLSSNPYNIKPISSGCLEKLNVSSDFYINIYFPLVLSRR